MTRESCFRIEGMCCAEETTLLRREVGPALNNPEESLRFDLLRGLMIVDEPLDADRRSQLLEIVSKTGMKGVVVDAEEEAESQTTVGRGRRPLLVSTIIASAATLLGLALSIAGTGNDGVLSTLGYGLYLVASAVGLYTVLPKAWVAIRFMRPDMNLLMSVAVIGAIIIEEPLEGAIISSLFAFSLLLESWSIGRARRAVERLMERAPERAVRLADDGSEQVISPTDVQIGDRLLVRPGDSFPVDGRVAEGRGDVDAAAVTGESRPVAVDFGSPVWAGTTNIDATLTIVAVRQASESTWARIVRLVEEAGSRRSSSERWVERFARIYTPLVFLGAILFAVIPPLFGLLSWTDAIYRGLVILVIGCPCALVIATPVAVVAGLARAARMGVLVKGGEYIEAPARLEAIAFDKTGTLTTGEPEVSSVVTFSGDPSNNLVVAAAVARGSSHPLSRGLLNSAEGGEREVPRADDVRQVPGRGLRGRVGDDEVLLGSLRFLAEEGIDISGGELARDKENGTGGAHVALAIGGNLAALYLMTDTIRPDAPEVIAELRHLGIRTIMITGDAHDAGRHVADAIGITDVVADVRPEGKVAAVESLLTDRGRVAMVGDGINDAPAMARADLGIAMGERGTDVALETADIALMGDDLRRIPWLIRHSRRALTTIRTNIGLALGIKLIVLIGTFLGLASLWGAIIADIGATLLVSGNALRLLSKRG